MIRANEPRIFYRSKRSWIWISRCEHKGYNYVEIRVFLFGDYSPSIRVAWHG